MSPDNGVYMPESLFGADFQAVYGGVAAAYPSPADWRDLPIYFLMVDRFNNPVSPPVHAPFDDPSFSGFQGGSFSGVRKALGYIKRLGAGAIWLSPVLKNLPFRDDAYHCYGIHDFLHAEPRFASVPEAADDELRALVDAAHAEGLYVILDIVLNHTGDVFAYAADPMTFQSSPQPVRWRDDSAVNAAPERPRLAKGTAAE
jgi:glycosidase